MANFETSMQVNTIFEDDFLHLVVKPAGLAVKEVATVLHSKAEPVHRLDQRVSGLLLLAKTAESLAYLNEAFKNRNTQKKYWAVVANKPKLNEATLQHWLMKNVRQQKAIAFSHPRTNAKEALLSYRLQQSSEKYHLLEIDLQTGRFHQIRAQLAAIGSPIVGDIKYGYPRTVADKSIFLHAYSLAFPHPITKAICSYKIPMPETWLKYGLGA